MQRETVFEGYPPVLMASVEGWYSQIMGAITDDGEVRSQAEEWRKFVREEQRKALGE